MFCEPMCPPNVRKKLEELRCVACNDKLFHVGFVYRKEVPIVKQLRKARAEEGSDHLLGEKNHKTRPHHARNNTCGVQARN